MVSSRMDLFLSSFFLGIAFCAPPGIVTVEAVRRGIARGFWATLLVELGSLIGDATWAILALGGLAFLVQSAPVRLALGLMGTVFLFYLGWSAIRDARKSVTISPANPGSRKDFSTGALLSLGNPFTVAFWLGIGGAAITATDPHPGLPHFLTFFTAFMLGALLWCFILAGLVVWGRRLVNPAFFRWVNLTCGLFLCYFGINLFWNVMQGFF
jgi:chemosensory pili system protein ChpE